MADQKVYMLNALWFKPDGGAEKYAEYALAAGPFVAKYGATMKQGYAPTMSLIGDWNPDLFFIVEWPSWEAFEKLPADPDYLAIAHLREEALLDSLLIRCDAVTGIGVE
ncbi:MAG: hypothetical protein ACI8TX_003330 [Hyphomicrobiaceae bacterium]|jgi:uncharacterized protein (DUF1330 family)